MTKITIDMANEAIKQYNAAKAEKENLEAFMKRKIETIEQYALDHLEEFQDGKLQLVEGTLSLRAGTAKPIKDGRSLPQDARALLALDLPQEYRKYKCDFAKLYQCQDKYVRQILQKHRVEIVREDTIVIN